MILFAYQVVNTPTRNAIIKALIGTFMFIRRIFFTARYYKLCRNLSFDYEDVVHMEHSGSIVER